MPATLRLSIRPDTRAPSAARAGLRAVRGVDDDVRAVGLLLLSELVANAVLHAGLAPEERIEVSIRVSGGLRVEVADHGHWLDAGAPAAADRDGGRGLFLVERLASRWGAETAGGTWIWFELDGPATMPPARPVTPPATNGGGPAST